MKINDVDNSDKFELDELDLLLISELELDARQANVVLAKKLNTSQMTVKRRLERLLDAGVITFATIVNMMSQVMGATIGLKIESGKSGEVAEHLKTYGNIRGLLMTEGRYDILIFMVFSNFTKLIDFLDEEMSHIPHLLDTEKMIVLEATKVSWKYINNDTNLFPHPQPREFDELDLNLIKELELCPRESIKLLADKLGVNRKLVSKKLQALLTDGILHVVSIVKPSFLGLNVPVFIFVKVRPGRVRSIAQSLVKETRVRHICIITGPFEIFVNAIFKDLDELSNFLMNRLGSYAGVISHEILLHVGPHWLRQALLYGVGLKNY